MDGGMALTYPRRASAASASPSMAWPSAERRVSFQHVQQLPRNVANNYPEMWSKPHFLCSGSKLMKNGSLWIV